MFRHQPGFFVKPENALKRAEELEAVGQTQAALKALHDVITSRRHRSWSSALEGIMMKYIDLCVELRKGRFAKDGLIQFRQVCQTASMSSLEDVIQHFMEKATQKAVEASEKLQVSSKKQMAQREHADECPLPVTKAPEDEPPPSPRWKESLADLLSTPPKHHP